MRILEKTLIALAIISTIMIFIPVAGGSLIMGLSISTLAMIYYALGFALFNNIRLRDIFKKASYKGISAIKIVGTIGAGISLSILCIGIFFKLLHLAGTGVMLSTGVILCSIVLIVVLIKFINRKTNFYKNTIIRMGVYTSLGLILFLTPSLILKRIKLQDNSSYMKAYEKYVKDPENEELKHQLDIEYYRATMSEEAFENYLKEEESSNNP